jgi:glycosyltransferase involved in cell wall biosynthesis
MSFPYHDSYWVEVQQFLEQHVEQHPSSTDAILAPNEFLGIFSQTYPYNITYTLPARHFDLVVLHKAMLGEIDPTFLTGILQRFFLVFENDVFAIYAKRPPVRQEPVDDSDIRSLLQPFLRPQSVSPPTCGIVVVTRDRPHALARSLPQLVALGAPVVIVDDGSSSDQYQANQQLADQHQATLLYLPQARGNPSALNTGVSYWLADPHIDWISCFRDEVDVHPDLLAVLAQIQDPRDRPLLSGRDASEHAVLKTEAIGPYIVLLKRSTSGVHLHAHRTYWAGVLPIPTPDVQHDTSGRGTEEDWWITAWSPRSVVKQGGAVVCVPGLVRTVTETLAEDNWRATSLVQPTVIQQSDPDPTPTTIAIAPIKERSPQPTPSRPSSRDRPSSISSLKAVKVLVDGYNLQMTSGTGIKTYTTSLIKALKQLGAQVDVLLSRNASKVNEVLDEVLFFDNQNRDRNLLLDSVDSLKGLVRASLGPLYQAQRRRRVGDLVVKQGKYGDDFLAYAESFNLPRCYDVANALYKRLRFRSNLYVSEKIDLWHATYPLPITIQGARKITTIHDLIPLRLPYATLDDKEVFYFKVRDALQTSSVIVTVSEHSKKDLLAYFDADPDQIVVTYQPIALEYEELPDEEVSDFLKRYGLKYQDYLLFVGAIEPKKNLGRLLDAYALLDTQMPLVVVGKKGWLWEDEIGKVGYLFEKGPSKQVKLLEYVPATHLKYLYRGAYCLVFPSLYEGFGLPPLEAMTFGCPVITSRISSLPEVCGNAALYVDPYEVADIQRQLERILGDRELRNQLAEMGRENAEFFSAENYLERLATAYMKALA